ncbi:transposase [Streptomyces sp. NPDC048156]|uniref:transposase n=1 Tax=Streptomyces sp. NPDC048156 TaxID=3365502 RepID=UPI00371A0E87
MSGGPRLERQRRLHIRARPPACRRCPQEAAACPRRLLKRGATKINSPAREHHPAAPAGGGGAPGEALGRSRGGLTTKIHVAAEGRCRPLSLLITPGQRADCTQFEPVMGKIRVPRTGVGRPRRIPDSVSADKAYSNRTIRTYLRKRGIRHVIPEKKDHEAARLRRGSRGGRRRALTRRDTKIATRWSGRSTRSSSSERSPPAMTSADTSSSALSPPPHSSSGSAHDRSDELIVAHRAPPPGAEVSENGLCPSR